MKAEDYRRRARRIKPDVTTDEMGRMGETARKTSEWGGETAKTANSKKWRSRLCAYKSLETKRDRQDRHFSSHPLEVVNI